jgi:hypothetical protein
MIHSRSLLLVLAPYCLAVGSPAQANESADAAREPREHDDAQGSAGGALLATTPQELGYADLARDDAHVGGPPPKLDKSSPPSAAAQLASVSVAFGHAASETASAGNLAVIDDNGPVSAAAQLASVPVALSYADLVREDASASDLPPARDASGPPSMAAQLASVPVALSYADVTSDDASAASASVPVALGYADVASEDTLAGPSMPSPAAAGDEAMFASGEAETLSDAELSEQRGGFRYEGMDIQFGAEIRSYINDELVYQTNISWLDGATDVERSVSTQLTPAAAAEMGAELLGGGGINLRVGNENVYFANQGQTAFIQRADGSLQNIIVNSASNIALRQQIDAQLDISNFAPFRADVLSDKVASALSAMIGSGLRF